MKRLLMFIVASAFAVILAGCSSVPVNPNMSGKWSYLYGKDFSRTGSLKLAQTGTKITGVSNDAEEQADVEGSIVGSVLSLQGKSQKTGKTTYMINAKMCSENEFEGIYTTSVGRNGKIKAKRE
jgi:hypothetical protein